MYLYVLLQSQPLLRKKKKIQINKINNETYFVRFHLAFSKKLLKLKYVGRWYQCHKIDFKPKDYEHFDHYVKIKYIPTNLPYLEKHFEVYSRKSD